MSYWSGERQRNGENRPRPFGLWRESGVPGDRSSSLGWKIRGPRRQVFVAGVGIRGPRRQVFVAGVGIRGPRRQVFVAGVGIRGPRRQVLVAGVGIRGPRRQVFVAGVEIRPYFVLALDLGAAKARRGEARPRLAGFLLTTPSTPAVLTGPGLSG